MKSIVIVMMCGLPGAGKTTLVTKLEHYVTTNYPLEWSCQVVSYDEIAKEIIWNEISFAMIRCKGVTILQDIIQQRNNSFSTSSSSSSSSLLIIIDDNMYMKSMRREIYVIAREAAIPSIVLWCKMDERLCQERNAGRNDKERVSDASFDNIVQRFEPPNPHNIYDRHLFIWEGSEDENEGEDLKKIFDKIMEVSTIAHECSHHDDPSPLPSASIKIQCASKLLDEKIRKVVAQLMTSCTTIDLPKREVGQLLANQKKVVMEEGRSSSLWNLASEEEGMEYVVFHLEVFGMKVIKESVAQFNFPSNREMEKWKAMVRETIESTVVTVYNERRPVKDNIN